MNKNFFKISNFTWVSVISVVAIFLAVYFAIFQNKREYNEVLRQSKLDLNRLADVISSNIEISFISIDQTLKRASERYYFGQLFGKYPDTDMNYYLKKWVTDFDHLKAMFATDRYGRLESFYTVKDDEMILKGEYLNVISFHINFHKQSNKSSLYATPLIGNNSQEYMISSHRIKDINGKFSGVVFAVIDVNKIFDLLKSVERENKSRIAVVHNNGKFLMSTFEEKQSIEDAVLSFKDANKKNNLKGEDNITTIAVGDNIHVFAKRSLNNLPLNIYLSFDDSNILKNLRETEKQYLVFLIILVSFILLVLVFFYLFEKQIKVSMESETKALLASQAKSDFLAKMSHELRTPLNAIIGFSEMLGKKYFGKLNDDQLERVNDINMCGNHLLELINDVLDFSKGEAGKMKLKEEIFDLYYVINNAIRIVEQKSKSASVRIINKIHRDELYIYADNRKIKQVFINLLSNSIKFTPEKGRITISKYFDINKNIIVKIEDTGRGMNSRDIPRAMSVFEQVHSEDDRKGTGLGLPLCKMIINLHGGKFNLLSSIGKGTTAYVKLPKKRHMVKYRKKLEGELSDTFVQNSK